MPLLVQPVSASHVPAARPCERSGHGAPVFTSDLRDQQFGCEHTGPLRHVTGFPGLVLLRVLRPIPLVSAGNRPFLPASRLLAGRNQQDGSHVHFLTVRQGRRPAMLLQPRHGYAADLHHGLPDGDINRPKSHRTQHRVWVCVAARPRSARFEPLGLLRSVLSLVPHVHLSVLLAGPGPSDSTGPFRRCQGCCPPSPLFQGSGCPQLQYARCDKHEAVSFHHRTVRKRLVALYVGDPQLVRFGAGEVPVNQI